MPVPMTARADARVSGPGVINPHQQTCLCGRFVGLVQARERLFEVIIPVPPRRAAEDGGEGVPVDALDLSEAPPTPAAHVREQPLDGRANGSAVGGAEVPEVDAGR